MRTRRTTGDGLARRTGRRHQRRIQTAQGSGAWDPVRYDPYPVGLHRRPVAADDQDVRGEAVQERQLSLEYRMRADHERALVDATEPPGLAACEDGCCPGYVPIRA